jgi:hypothetical protein
MDMSGLMGMMADPEMREAMANPKVQKALQEVMSGPGGPAGLMSNPAKLQELMSDPEVGPVIQKLMSKMGGAGGMGGMPGMGGAPEALAMTTMTTCRISTKCLIWNKFQFTEGQV